MIVLDDFRFVSNAYEVEKDLMKEIQSKLDEFKKLNIHQMPFVYKGIPVILVKKSKGKVQIYLGEIGRLHIHQYEEE